MGRNKENPVGFISGQTLDFSWSTEQKYAAVKMLIKGAKIIDLAEEFERDILEIYILVDDLIKMRLVVPDRSMLREVS